MATKTTVTTNLVEHPSRSPYETLVDHKDHTIETTKQAEELSTDGDNPFADPEVAERYAVLYEKAQYECRHVFDPTMTWTPEEEKAIVRKLDWRVCLWAVCSPALKQRWYMLIFGTKSASCSSDCR